MAGMLSSRQISAEGMSSSSRKAEQTHLGESTADQPAPFHHVADAYQRLEQLSVTQTPWNPPDAAVMGLLRQVNQQSHLNQSYRTRVLVKDVTNAPPTKDGIAIEWRVEYVRPDRFAVDQIAWADGSADRWVSVGKDHYAFLLIWVPGNQLPNQGHYPRLNAWFRIEKYLDLMKHQSPTQVAEVANGETAYLVCRYTPTEWPAFNTGWPLKSPRYDEVTFWINKDTHRLEKADVRFSGIDDTGHSASGHLEQFVIDYDSDIAIERPKAER